MSENNEMSSGSPSYSLDTTLDDVHGNDSNIDSDALNGPPPRILVASSVGSRARRPRPSYENEDEDEYSDTPIESEGECDPNEESGQTKDDEPEPNTSGHWKSVDEYIERLVSLRPNLPQALPLVRFRRKLQAAGYGETFLPGSAEGDLDNDIHPIFQQQNWIRERRFGAGNINEDDLLWRQMKPALQLATKLITNKNVLGWWVRTLFGKKTFDKKTGRWYISEPKANGENGYKGVQLRLQNLVGRVRWSFADLLIASGVGDQTLGMLANSLAALDNFSGPRKGYVPPHLEPPRALHIGVNTSYRTFFLRDHDSKTPCQVLRTNWFMAITMTHELAHAFYASKAAQPSFQEPYFDVHDRRVELGWSWEQSIFGCGSAQSYIDANLGAIAPHWEPFMKSKAEPFICIDSQNRFPIHTHYIHSFFLKKVWEMLDAVSETEKAVFWHVPTARVGLTAAPKRRNEEKCRWIWISDEYPPHHRLSIRYWDVKNEMALKKLVYARKVERDKAKQEASGKNGQTYRA